MADTVTVDLGALTALVQTLAQGPTRLRTIAQAAMRRGAARAAKRSRELVAGEVLKVRTGTLRRSISHVVEASGDTITGRVGILKGEKTLVYAGVLEGGPSDVGTVIRPTKAKVLTIPLEASLKPSGAPKWTAREAGETYLTFWHRMQGGTRSLILFGYKGAGKNVKERQLVPLFLGVPKVTIMPRHYLRRGATETLPSIRAAIQSQVIAALLTKAGPTGSIDAD